MTDDNNQGILTEPILRPEHAYPHEPPHRYSLKGTYMVTAATLHKKHLFNTPEKVKLLHDIILEETLEKKWILKAWAVFNNHYHFIAQSSENPESLPALIKRLHSLSALRLNRLDGIKGRKVWHQYWDTNITYRNSYFARLNYVIQNPVKHALVSNAKDYQWCSASWFEKYADKEFRKMVLGYKFDQLKVPEFY